MTKKRYSGVVEMMNDLTDDRTFADELSDHLAQREVVTELVALRAARGLTQEDIATRIGCSQGRISKLESSTHAALNLATLVEYADAVGFRVEMTLAGKGVTLVDRLRHHASCIKKLTDQLARLGSKDERIADGVAGFLSEAADNLVRLVQSSAKLLLPSCEESPPPIAIDVFGLDDRGETECRGEESRMARAK